MNQVKPCRYGLMIYQPNDAYIGRSLDLYGEFSEAEVALFRAAALPGHTVLDVGANIGAHTLALARLVGPSGRVLAFEPQRIAYYSLCGNVVQNNLDQVVCHQAAIGDAAGKINVPQLDYRREQNFGAVDLTRVSGGTSAYSVPVVRIDDLGLTACHFIKIDVEGMERLAIKGAVETIRRFKPLLYVEDDRAEKSDALRELIDSLGYEMYSHRPPLFNADNFDRNPENVFGSTVSLNLYCCHRSAHSPIDPSQFGMHRVARPTADLPQMTIDDGSLSYAINEGRRLHQAGRIGHAEQLYRQILKFDAEQTQIWYLLGAACQSLGMPEDAIEAFGD